MPSERDLAAEHGLSPGTVRRGLATLIQEGILEPRRRSGVYVREKPRQKVIGIIVPNIENPDHAALVQLATRFAANRGYAGTVFIRGHHDPDVPRTPTSHLAFIERLAEMNAAGVIACPLVTEAKSNADFRKRIHSLDLPLVVVNDYWDECRDAHHVRVDQEADAEAIADHLIELGHQRIAFWMDAGNEWKTVTASFADRLREDGLESDGVVVDEVKAEEWVEKRYLEVPAGRRPTAVVIPYHKHARRVLNAFLKAGVDVPKDVSVVGMGGPLTPEGETLELTTTHAPMARIVEKALDLLVNPDPGAVCHVRFKSELRLGATTGGANI